MTKLTVRAQEDTQCFMEEQALRITHYIETSAGEESWLLEEYWIYAGKYHMTMQFLTAYI